MLSAQWELTQVTPTTSLNYSCQPIANTKCTAGLLEVVFRTMQEVRSNVSKLGPGITSVASNSHLDSF